MVAHDRDDTCVGEPLCVDCYDHERAVLFDALAPALFRQVTIATRRMLGLGAAELATAVHVAARSVGGTTSST